MDSYDGIDRKWWEPFVFVLLLYGGFFLVFCAPWILILWWLT